MIYCIWYPSGGFGHFINSILSLYGSDFQRPNNKPIFSENGNSHSLDLIAPKYYNNQPTYEFSFDPSKNYSVLIDNGINNESQDFRKFFPTAKIIKMCYSDFSWPVVANTMITKAMNSNIETEIQVDQNAWNTTEPWAIREKYFLFLRDHSLRNAWRPDTTSVPIVIENLLNYRTLKNSINLYLEDFESHWQAWLKSNYRYFLPVLTAQKILNGQFEYTSDIWTQAVVYYQIWCKYGIEVPHNDLPDFFQDASHYNSWLESVL